MRADARYDGGTWMLTLKTPPSYGVPSGPTIVAMRFELRCEWTIDRRAPYMSPLTGSTVIRALLSLLGLSEAHTSDR